MFCDFACKFDRKAFIICNLANIRRGAPPPTGPGTEARFLDWDDLRYFLAVAREGSLAGAAKRLGVNHSTVFRRIRAFEDRLGARLFERRREGYGLTVAGEEMHATAERIDGEFDGLERRLSGRDLRLGGPVAVTTSDSLMSHLLGPHLAGFRVAYPGIDLTVLVDNQFFNLSKRQADVAIRPTTAPPEPLVGRRVSGLAFAVYGGEGYLAARGDGENPDRENQDWENRDWAGHDWLVFDESMSHIAAARWLRGHVPDDAVALRSNSLSGLCQTAAAGVGLALLPCFMADPHPGLRRLGPPRPSAESALWLLTHEDLRHAARVRAFMDHMAAVLGAERDLLEGRRP